MAKVVLVNPPRSLHELAELAPPLGLLRLAWSLRRAGVCAEIIDFNLTYHEDHHLRSEDFYKNAVSMLLSENADAYGFTSMAVDSHVAIELGRQLKARAPDALVVVGGPHFSAIAADVKSLYPWIDHVVAAADATQAFVHLLCQYGLGATSPDSRPHIFGIGRSDTHQRPHSTSSADGEFHGIDLARYFLVNPHARIDFEWSRGCKYKCTFCYSPSFHVSVSHSSIDETVLSITDLSCKGVKEIFFVDDNFLNDWSLTKKFCDALVTARSNIQWHCYATLPDLTPERIHILRRAGCCSIFTGVDAVGPLSQATFHKSFLKSDDQLRNTLAACNGEEVEVTCAFMLSPPSHDCGEDFERTIASALLAATQGATVRLNTLALYNGTSAYQLRSSEPEFDDLRADLMLDVPRFVERNRYAFHHPSLFPFHSRYVSRDEWRGFLCTSHCLLSLLESYPKLLFKLWSEQNISPSTIAQGVLDKLPDLQTLAKDARRPAEQAMGAFIVGEKLAVFDADDLDQRELEMIETISKMVKSLLAA